MTEQVVEIFSNCLDEVLTEVGTLFGRWDTMPREERCPKALAALEKMAELARDADEVSTYLQEAYPPIRLTADEGWRERLNLVWEMIRRVMDKRLSVEEGTMSALLDVVIPDERDRKRIADTMVQVTSMEDLLLTTLSSAFSHLHDLLLALRAALDADRTETLALLYAKAEARYTQEVWREGEKGGEWDKFNHHLKHTKFPWYEPSCEQLQKYYLELAGDFDKTPLGQVFLENEDDPQALGYAIAEVGCKEVELTAFFRNVFRLREVMRRVQRLLNDAEPTQFPAHITYDCGVLLMNFLKEKEFIAGDTDSESFMYLMGCTDKKPANLRKIVWLANNSNKQLLRELVEQAFAGLINSRSYTKSEVEKFVPYVFVNTKGEAMTLAKNKPVPSFESDAIRGFFGNS